MGTRQDSLVNEVQGGLYLLPKAAAALGLPGPVSCCQPDPDSSAFLPVSSPLQVGLTPDGGTYFLTL